MNEQTLSREPLDVFLHDLSDDTLHISDEELRAEVREDGDTLEDYSARFKRTVRFVAPERVEASWRLPGVDPAPAVPFSPEALRPFPSVERTDGRFGPTRLKSRPVIAYEGVVTELLDLLPEFEPAPCTSVTTPS